MILPIFIYNHPILRSKCADLNKGYKNLEWNYTLSVTMQIPVKSREVMALLFIAGVTNWVWVALIAMLVIAEKVFSRGHLFGKLGGIVKLALATFILSESLFS